MFVGQAYHSSPELLAALQKLIPQLGVHLRPPTIDELDALIRSESTRLVVARYPNEDDGIKGILSLTVYRVPTGVHSIIEDVVVDETARRQGIGEALLRHAISLAHEAGANGVTLTSNPGREAANRLYQSLGFEQRHTNSYLYRLK